MSASAGGGAPKAARVDAARAPGLSALTEDTLLLLLQRLPLGALPSLARTCRHLAQMVRALPLHHVTTLSLCGTLLLSAGDPLAGARRRACQLSAVLRRCPALQELELDCWGAGPRALDALSRHTAPRLTHLTLTYLERHAPEQLASLARGAGAAAGAEGAEGAEGAKEGVARGLLSLSLSVGNHNLCMNSAAAVGPTVPPNPATFVASGGHSRAELEGGVDALLKHCRSSLRSFSLEADLLFDVPALVPSITALEALTELHLGGWYMAACARHLLPTDGEVLRAATRPGRLQRSERAVALARRLTRLSLHERCFQETAPPALMVSVSQQAWRAGPRLPLEQEAWEEDESVPACHSAALDSAATRAARVPGEGPRAPDGWEEDLILELGELLRRAVRRELLPALEALCLRAPAMGSPEARPVRKKKRVPVCASFALLGPQGQLWRTSAPYSLR